MQGKRTVKGFGSLQIPTTPPPWIVQNPNLVSKGVKVWDSFDPNLTLMVSVWVSTNPTLTLTHYITCYRLVKIQGVGFRR